MLIKSKGPYIRILCAICALCLLSPLLCSCGDIIVEPKWTVGVKGAKAPVFSSLDYGKLPEISAITETAQPDGSVAEETWQGVYLRDVLDYLGVTEYSSVTLMAGDGAACEYSPALINASSIILAAKQGGRELEDAGLHYIQVVAIDQDQSLWLDKLDKISINP